MSKDKRKEMIRTTFIDSCKEIIESEGYEQVSARKIGEISGYSYATLYNYFNDINELLAYACIDYIEDSYNKVVSEEIETWHPFDRLLEYMKRYYLYMVNNPSIFKVIFINDYGSITSELSQQLNPKVVIKMHQTIHECDLNHIKIPLSQLIELLASSLHAKIFFQVFNRTANTKEQDIVSLQKEIRVLMGYET